jgi:hypothetical protein
MIRALILATALWVAIIAVAVHYASLAPPVVQRIDLL